MGVEQHKVEDFIYTDIGNVKRHKGGYLVKCPICGDSKKNPNMKRCHINYYTKYNEWMYKCYNGGCPQSSGSILSLYAFVHCVEWIDAKRALTEAQYDPNKIKKRLKGIDKNVTHFSTKASTIDISTKDIIFSDSMEEKGGFRDKAQTTLKKFIEERKIPKWLKCSIAVSGRYSSRIIIPVVEKGELVYFQGRTIYKEINPKYLNPVVDKTGIIMNKDYFNRDKYIILTEGIIDGAMIEDRQGTSCLGAAPSDEMFKSLLSLTDKGIILALDNPNMDESGKKELQKIIKGSKYGKMIKYFIMPGTEIKDLNQLKIEKQPENIYDFILNNSFSHFKTNYLLKS